MTYTFRDLAIEVLQQVGHPLSSNEIWEYAQKAGIAQKIGSVGKTPGQTIGAQIYVDIRDNATNSVFVAAGIRPRRFTLHALMSLQEAEKYIETAPHEPESTAHYTEADLHPLLAYYADRYLDTLTKTIEESRSSKGEFGRWVHPDMVGCCFPFESRSSYREWNETAYQFASEINVVSIKLYSFELKQEIKFDNLRKVFFQAVSNSSWANEGYLVAASIKDDGDLMDELRRLSGSFGIGVILLNVEDPDASEIVFPARTKESVDWATVSKLSRMNPDFSGFLERVRKDTQTAEVRKELYDKVLSAEEIKEKFQQKR